MQTNLSSMHPQRVPSPHAVESGDAEITSSLIKTGRLMCVHSDLLLTSFVVNGIDVSSQIGDDEM
jgi:hypothetical protein